MKNPHIYFTIVILLLSLGLGNAQRNFSGNNWSNSSRSQINKDPFGENKKRSTSHQTLFKEDNEVTPDKSKNKKKSTTPTVIVEEQNTVFQNSDTAFTKNIIKQFIKLNQIPYEKLYIQTDKPYYSAGENIWYSGFMVDGLNNIPNTLSNYIYVELINKSDSVLIRQKLRRDSLNNFASNISLPADMKSGTYTLRGYSWWMANDDGHYVFQKKIKIGNNIDRSIQTSISYTKAEKETIATIQFYTTESIDFNKKKVLYQVYSGKNLVRSRSTNIDSNNKISFGFPHDELSPEQYTINIAFQDEILAYKTQFYMPRNNTTFDIAFLPEGGNLINNGYRKIAFKAIGQNGLSVDVEGAIFNEIGDTIANFESLHKGMGSFSISVYDTVPQIYTAKATIKGTSNYKTFTLPTVSNSSFGLTMSQIRNKINFSIIYSEKVETFPRMYLVAQQRGQFLFSHLINSSNNLIGRFSNELFKDGIVQFSLIDSTGAVISERLIFVKKEVKQSIGISADKDIYSKRDKVKLELNLENYDLADNGQFAISVTEDETVKLDSLSENIQSHLLLTSDLRGYIEEPRFYFENSANATRALDLVMLTNGWRRFDIGNVVIGKFPKHKNYIEIGQSISGKIKNFIGQDAKSAQVIVMAPKIHYMSTINADEQGNFVADGVSFKDSTTFVVQGRTRRGSTAVEVEVEKQQFLNTKTIFPYQDSLQNVADEVDDYMKLMEQKFHFEGGERVYHLKEVVVTGSKRSSSTSENPLYAGYGNPVTNEDLDRFSGQSVLEVLQTFVGVTATPNSISIRGSTGNPLVVIDDMTYDSEEDVSSLLSSIPASEVDYVNVLKGTETSIFGSRGGNGVVIINFKTGASFTPTVSTPGLEVYMPLGYYTPSEFYSPKYDVTTDKSNTKPDLRTTIYWNPDFKIKKGESTTLDFYTADRKGTYTITIEGVTESGNILYKQQKISTRGE